MFRTKANKDYIEPGCNLFLFFPVIKLSFVQVALNLVQLSENYYVIHGYGGCSRLFEAMLGQRRIVLYKFLKLKCPFYPLRLCPVTKILFQLSAVPRSIHLVDATVTQYRIHR